MNAELTYTVYLIDPALTSKQQSALYKTFKDTYKLAQKVIDLAWTKKDLSYQEKATIANYLSDCIAVLVKHLSSKDAVKKYMENNPEQYITNLADDNMCTPEEILGEVKEICVNYHGLKSVACRQFSIYEPG